jgi:hypothetical protein
LGLTTDDPDKPGTTQYTPLGLELNVELMSIFAGAVNLWDIPLLLDLMGHLDDEEADAIYTSTSQPGRARAAPCRDPFWEAASTFSVLRYAMV